MCQNSGRCKKRPSRLRDAGSNRTFESCHGPGYRE